MIMTKNKLIQIRLGDELYSWLDKHCKDANMERSSLVRRLLINYKNDPEIASPVREKKQKIEAQVDLTDVHTKLDTLTVLVEDLNKSLVHQPELTGSTEALFRSELLKAIRDLDLRKQLRTKDAIERFLLEKHPTLEKEIQYLKIYQKVLGDFLKQGILKVHAGSRGTHYTWEV